MSCPFFSSFLFAFSAGEDTDTNVKPNEYQEKELDINSNILRDQTKYEQSKRRQQLNQTFILLNRLKLGRVSFTAAFQ
ncbi:type VII secretion protein EssA [Bacillus sp. SL00103]